MKAKSIFAAIVSLTLSVHASAGIYKCGNSFSDKPCPGAAQVDVKFAKPSADDVRMAKDRTESAKKFVDDSKKSTRKAEIMREISSLESDIKVHERQMDIEIALLRQKKGYAANNLAGATWEQSISTEMQAVSDKYGALIKSKSDRIANLKRELERL